jgi:NTP pyrophosphatase (non-canonical NTP hydrolase)
MSEDRLEALREDLRSFVAERDWEQFHTPKDLAVGLSVEAGELLEGLQWRDPDADELRAEGDLEEVAAELADVLLYALLLADELDVDLLEAAEAKLAENREKYPADEVRGSATKYTEL